MRRESSGAVHLIHEDGAVVADCPDDAGGRAHDRLHNICVARIRRLHGKMHRLRRQHTLDGWTSRRLGRSVHESVTLVI